MSPPPLDRLPLAEQLALFAAALDHGEPRTLLQRAAALSDPEPLAWLCGQLHGRRWLSSPEHREFLASLLLDRPDTALDRALRSLAERPGAELSGLLELMLERLGPERIATVSLLDRVFRRSDPPTWRQRLARLEREAILDLGRGILPSLARLAQLPGSVHAELQGVAARVGLLPALSARQAELAEAVYAALAAAPKGLSQTNAEALLSKQVYTEPGHFIVELLQNAVDTGARRFSVRFERERVVLHHDGLPFDARDVVGVCSIGQTTKRQDQIGFFGVGFKSVYELTERPRVHSEGWNFEIADVSVPRPLGGRPADLPQDGTVIVLPLRPGLDAARSPRALYEKTARLDPCVLLTLPGLERLEASLEAPALRRELQRVEGQGGLSTILENPAGIARSYRVAERVYTRRGAAEQLGRPEETTVKVGLACAPDGSPTPLSPEARLVYSYLPTEERSGLRFWVQGHFEVPVDRERVNPESAWNQDIVKIIPEILADLCRSNPPQQALALAELLPLPTDIESPLWRPVAAGLPAALGELPLLPDARGTLRPARELIVAEPAIAALFDEEPLAGSLLGATGTLRWLHPAASERVRALAISLGAHPLAAPSLLDAVERWMRRIPDGSIPTDPDLPLWIRNPEPVRLMALVQLLLTAPGPSARVGGLPLLPGDEGALYRAPRLHMAEAGVRALLFGLLPMVHPALEEEDSARATLVRIGVRSYKAADALGALERLLEGVEVLPPDGGVLGVHRLRRAWQCFAETPPELARRALGLPLVLCEDGQFYPGKDVALRAPTGPFANALRVLYGPLRPVAVEDPELDAWLQRADAERLDVDTLLCDLGGALVPELGRVQAFHAALAEHWRTLPTYAVELLVQQPLWPTLSGEWQPVGGLVDAPELLALCAPGTPERAAIEAWMCEGPPLDSLRALRALAKSRSATDAARELVRRLARPGEPVAAQTPLLRFGRAPLAAILRAEDPNLAVPIADATGCLRTDRRYAADPGTRALLRGLPVEGELMAEGEPGLPPQVEPLPPLAVLQAMATHAPKDRGALYSWILEHERELMSDPSCRTTLAEAPLLLSAQGRPVAARDLVLDPELPALGIDAMPAPEVPEALIRLLVRQLGVGQLTPEELLVRHLRPAYEAAAKREDRAGAAALLDTLLQRAQPLVSTIARKILHDLPLEDARGHFRPASSLLEPDPRIAAEVALVWPWSRRLHPARLATLSPSTLADLGVRAWPDEAELRDALVNPTSAEVSIALCGVLGALQDEALLRRLPLRAFPWLPDGAGRLRHPESLYQRGPEIEALIGEDPSFYPHEQVLVRLSPTALSLLKLGGPERVGPDEVVAHIARRAEAGESVSPRVYAWMEQGLAEGRVPAQLLRDRLRNRPWILSDDGRFLPAERVLGEPTLHLFGLRRGAWSRGVRAYPQLAAAFSIPAELSPPLVAAFLSEIAAELGRSSDAVVLASEPGLPRLLLACFDQLGRAGVSIDRSLPVVPAVPARGGPPRLVAANTPGLYRSDTPTLEALFTEVGPLLLAARGEGELGPGVEQFLESVGVPRLRGAWRARIDEDPGADTTEQNGAEIAELRGMLRALAGVLPRVQAWRSNLSREGWRWGTRLRALGASGPIRCVQGLRVRLELPGVGIASASMDSLWDPQTATLLVDRAVLSGLPARGALLAEGLLPCVYEGSGEELLVEILEILLPLGTPKAMQAYLNRRHFPVVAEAEDPRERLRVRVGEILDYGLGKLLIRRFDALRNARVERWRDPALLAELPAEPAAASQRLLRALGVPEAGEHAEELQRLLALPRLSEAFSAPAEEAAPEPAPEPASWREPPEPELRTTVPPPPLPRVEPTPSFFHRLRQALFGGVSPRVPDRSEINPFAPSDRVVESFWATPEAQRAAVEQRSPGRLEFLPTPLPRPYLYVVSTLAGDFDPGRQLWREGALPTRAAPLRPTAFTVSFNGTLPPGLCRLPLPMFSILDGPVEILRGPPGSVSPPQRSSMSYSVEVVAPAPVTVRYTARLCELPGALEAHLEFPKLREPTLPPEALPEAVRRWLQSRDRAASPVVLARAVEQFVQQHYAYDRDYLVRPEVVAARSRLRQGRGHHALEVLHASPGSGLLGRGMCAELNAMIVELGRHLGLPMAVANGWMMDLGYLERPDHLFAALLLSTPEGPVWMPLDAARSHDLGAQAPLGSPGVVAPPRLGVWQEPEGAPVRVGFGQPVGVEAQLRAVALDLEKALRLSCEARGLPLPKALVEARALPPGEAAALLGPALEATLPRPELAPAVVALVRGDYQGLDEVPPEARELQALGLATLERAATWRARPVR